jgi:hypothetical protein
MSYMETKHLRPAPGTEPTTEMRDRWEATCWTTATGERIVAMADGDVWEIWIEETVEVDGLDGGEVSTRPIAPGVDVITAAEMAAIVG